MKLIISTLAASLLVVSGTAHSAKFANQFSEFELPPRWQCNLEGAEWVCQSSDDAKKRDAIIVLAAKLKGDQDSLDQYENYLKTPKVYQSVQGKSVKSEPKYAKSIQLNNHPWVDSLHLESEIPGFYTRYLATVKQDIGILVTYSVNKDKWSQYLADFESMVNTLRVFRKAGGINAAPAGTNLFANTNIPAKIEESTVFPAQPPAPAAKQKQSDDLPLPLIAIIVAVVGYLIWRRRQQS